MIDIEFCACWCVSEAVRRDVRVFSFLPPVSLVVLGLCAVRSCQELDRTILPNGILANQDHAETFPT